MTALALGFGVLLGWAARRFRVEQDPVVERIDRLLPQTQCGQCGFAGCRPYAEAMAAGEADINQCPPGGDVTVADLADLLRVPLKPLDPAFGATTPRVRAVIDEAICIGCKKCIDACPVDAIVGAAKLMHTVIEADCTGCGLCVPPCPVDCIALVPISVKGERWPDYRNAEIAHWRQLTERRLGRLARNKSIPPRATDAKEAERARIRAEIAAAVARSRAKRSVRTL